MTSIIHRRDSLASTSAAERLLASAFPQIVSFAAEAEQLERGALQ